MSRLLPIQLQDLDWYNRETRRWAEAINRYTSRSSSQNPLRKALAAFYSPFENDGKLLLKGLREGFEPILDLQIEAVCKYLDITRDELRDEYLL